MPASAAERGEVLHAGYLVARRAVIFGEFGFDYDLRVELVGNDEVGRLIESGEPLRSSGLAKADAGAGQYVLDGALDKVSDQLAYGIPVRGKRPAQETFVQQHGIGDAQVSERTEALQAVPGIRLVESMEVVARHVRDAGFKKAAGAGDQCADAVAGHRSFPGERCFGVHTNGAVNGSSCTLGDLHAGVTHRVNGPLRGREAQDAAQDQERCRRLDDSRSDRFGTHDPKPGGGSFQGLVAGFERAELDESLAARHNHEFRLQ